MTKLHNQKPAPVSVRLSADERLKLEQLSQGISLSAYIRASLFGDDALVRKTRRRSPTPDEVALARLLGLLGQSRIANNLNQLSKEAHLGRLRLTPDTEAKISEAYDHIKEMRNELIRALGLAERSDQ